jgi:hypothetical protein
MENLDNTTTLDNGSDIMDSIPPFQVDTIPFLDEQPSLPLSSPTLAMNFELFMESLTIVFSMTELVMN